MPWPDSRWPHNPQLFVPFVFSLKQNGVFLFTLRSVGVFCWTGLVCPHFDQIQSNGILRATDFDEMVLRHPQERGIGIGNWWWWWWWWKSERLGFVLDHACV
jgi:hypothetical protein